MISYDFPMRSEVKSVNFTKEEKVIIERAADSMGLSYGSFLRSAGLEKAKEQNVEEVE